MLPVDIEKNILCNGKMMMMKEARIYLRRIFQGAVEAIKQG